MSGDIDWTKAETVDIAIIGSGPGGSTAALYAARAGFKVIVLHGEVPGGQLTTTTELENFPGWKGTGPGLVEAIEKQATEAGAEYKYEVVTKVDFSVNPKLLSTDMDTHYKARSVIVATGAKALYLGLPNEERLKGKGVSGCATCDGPLYKGKDVVVVGGGDAAAEEAIFLSKICKSVKLVHRRDQLRASLPMRKRVEASSIQMIWNTVIEDVLGENKVTGVKVKNVVTNEVSEIPCDGLFVAIGHKPATEVFKDYLQTDEQGYFLTNGTPVTSIPGVFVCGDCADRHYRQAITSAATGCQAALLAEKYLTD
ncbi:thioredoxin-disulfide reductase family protein [Trichomonas vaginalis G3]|uniref:Thioredoxin reductase n=1 Tax=Trichomonas vaginalis (strain ATCC PRA-98 / G3) TaxID=412133 RepID=A2F9L1_TRIV3|nr:thioredoxin-disulfide reductase protein [Trichomonas vaginalis G3]EAX98392.1 thioredoxin-disulfide reductase family protein [Trichomonas vaginalis G3]KAI5486577.1 thioredoxin-disulfide reductase protein [Trichomonas vaginalis G3]|eukprot:XP_001311322.1 thioredoxin-disulfide reductase family protein [Trichomonas vaginalis G3]